MTRSEVNTRLEQHLPRLRTTFDRLIAIEGDGDVDWVALLKLREDGDRLTDDTFLRGYLVGMADALEISLADLVEVLRTRARPKRRIVRPRHTSTA